MRLRIASRAGPRRSSTVAVYAPCCLKKFWTTGELRSSKYRYGSVTLMPKYSVVTGFAGGKDGGGGIARYATIANINRNARRTLGVYPAKAITLLRRARGGRGRRCLVAGRSARASRTRAARARTNRPPRLRAAFSL